jgi:hypothetical protein
MTIWAQRYIPKFNFANFWASFFHVFEDFFLRVGCGACGGGWGRKVFFMGDRSVIV